MIRPPKRFFTGVLLVLYIIASQQAVVMTAAAQAVPGYDEDFNSRNDVRWWDPRDSSCGNATGLLTGGTNDEKILNFLLSKGFNSAQASGILGNISHESGFNPFRMQNTYDLSQGLDAVLPIDDHDESHKAFGIVQWDSGRRQTILNILAGQFPDYKEVINAYGKRADDPTQAPDGANDKYLQIELEFLYQELSEGYKAVYDAIRALPDDEAGMKKAASIWNRQFEVSGDSNENRIKAAEPYYEKYKGRTATSDSSVSTSVCNDLDPAGDIVHYYQCDERWGGLSYSGDTMCQAGCGPTSMAMILTALVDKNITPMDVVAVVGNQVDGVSDRTMFVNGVSAKWGVRIESTQSFDDMYEFLKSGQGMVWVGGDTTNGSEPPFMSQGHIVALTGVTSTGNITVADSAGGSHPAIADYTAEQIGRSHTFFKVYKK